MISVVIATLGRPHLIKAMLSRLQQQSRQPEYIVLAVADAADLPPDASWSYGVDAAASGSRSTVKYLPGPKGLTRQRNRAVDWLCNQPGLHSPNDAIVFFDDDFVPAADWLENAEATLLERPEVAGLTGVVLADGAALRGYEEGEALAIIAANHPVLPEGDWRVRPGKASLYGCNMAVRMDLLRECRFDEKLPLYAWLEDYDFSTRLSRKGELTRVPSLVGVHLGEKTGRVSGRKLGYSQVANAIYLSQKGTMSRYQAAIHASKNVAANLLKSLRPEEFIDRRGRLMGNLDAARDLIRGQLNPARVEVR